MNDILYLGSQSKARQQLLREAQIAFDVVDLSADEAQCGLFSSLQESVEHIALYKMEHIILPHGNEGDVCFALCADTLSQSLAGVIQGKPTDRADAIEKIKSARGGSRVGTSFCLDKRVYRSGQWTVFKRIQKYVSTEYIFDIPDEWVDIYLEKSFSFSSSGAIAVEVYGSQFLKSVSGSYSAIVGLPMFELREALQELGFFSL